MVSDAQLAAKIDSKSGHVILGVQPPDVYQQAPIHTMMIHLDCSSRRLIPAIHLAAIHLGD